MNRLLISAAHKSSGKTTISIGLCAALKKRGLVVQPFKKGPDYIDPLWLGMAAGRPCYTLDGYLMSPTEIGDEFARHSRGADIALIEGNKGLYDGLDLDGGNSNAALATLLDAPVVLVIDARGMTRGIAPLILGYQAFDNRIRIEGVILNRLGGSRHEAKLRAVIEHYTDIPVLGAIQHDEALQIVERHLGLIPSNEMAAANTRIDAIASVIATQVDLEKLLAVASRSGLARDTLDVACGAMAGKPAPTINTIAESKNSVRIGIARDAAFGFYYPGDLDALQAAGAELVIFDAIHDKTLPAVDGLFIGGGFPEAHMDALAANRELQKQISAGIESGMPVYAECGGLMYLARRIEWNGRSASMVGVIPADIKMHARPVGRGYVHLRETEHGLWPRPGNAASAETTPLIHAHEFHYSSVENLPPDVKFAYDVKRGYGIDGEHDGLVYKNLLASYTHLRDVANNHWATRFVAFVRRHKHKEPA